MPRNTGTPKTESLGFRIDAELGAKIDEAVRDGKFSAKSEVAVRALTQYFEREKCTAEMQAAVREEVKRLLTSDPEVTELLKPKIV